MGQFRVVLCVSGEGDVMERYLTLQQIIDNSSWDWTINHLKPFFHVTL